MKNGFLCVTSLFVYLFLNPSTLCAEKSFWDHSQEPPRLLASAVENEHGEVELCRVWHYDSCGRRIQETIYGNLTGSCTCPLILEANGIPVENGIEKYATRYTYTEEEPYLLTSELHDNETSIQYEYDPISHQLKTKRLVEGDRIRLRQFFFYDQSGALIRSILDDGEGKESDDIKGITERHICTYTLRQEAPAQGMAAIIEESYLDLETQEERILQTTYNTYSEEGALIHQEVVDDKGTIRHSHSYTDKQELPQPSSPGQSSPPPFKYEQDSLQRVITISNEQGYVVHLRYNARGKPIEILYPDEMHERFGYHLDGSLAYYQAADGSKTVYYTDFLERITASEHYGVKGELIGMTTLTYSGFRLLEKTDIHGKTTFYKYDGAGRLISKQEINAAEPVEETYWNKILRALSYVSNSIWGTADYLREDLSYLNYIGPELEETGLYLFGKTFLAMSGFYVDQLEVGVYGDGEKNELVRLTAINGILNLREVCISSIDSISDCHGGNNIHYVFYPTEGWTQDLLSAVAAKLGWVTPQAQLLAQMWKQKIQEMGGPSGGGKVIHYAHSIGGTNTLKALELLTPEERKMIHVVTFGSATLIEEGACGSVVNYVSKRDGVSLIADPINFFRGLFTECDHIAFVGSFCGVPGVDHLLSSETYMAVIQALGEYFLKNHTEPQTDVDQNATL